MFTRSQLMKFCTSVLIKLRMDEEKANDTSDILIEADLMGHSTHGVRLLPLYINCLLYTSTLPTTTSV